jgi:hypothetical protein
LTIPQNPFSLIFSIRKIPNDLLDLELLDLLQLDRSRQIIAVDQGPLLPKRGLNNCDGCLASMGILRGRHAATLGQCGV